MKIQMQKTKTAIAKILEFRWHIMLSIFCLFMALVFAYMYAEQYELNKEQNIKLAAENQQRVLLDLKTGELIPEFEDIAAKKDDEKRAQDAKARPKITIIISDLGISKDSTDLALDFPKQTALAFNPYSSNSIRYSQRAEEMGHIIIAKLPMDDGEAVGTPVGKLEISDENDAFRNLQNIEAVLTKIFNPVAILMPEKELFSYTNGIEYLVDDLASKNLSIIYLGANQERMKILTNEAGNNLLIPDVVINDLVSEAEIRSKLKDLENIARDKGYAVIVLQPYPITLSIVKEWIGIMPQKSLELIPLRMN